MIDINRIKLLREELGITQKELGDKIGLSRSIVGSYEQGSRNPSFEVLEKLSNIFNCSVDYIMGISDIEGTEDEYFIKLGLSGKEYEALSEEKKEQLKQFAKFIQKNK